MSKNQTLTFDVLQEAIAGRAAAFRCVTEYQPAGGVGDKVFPPTYEGGKYAYEKRVVDGGQTIDCVLLDSVQSQANRMELALLDALRQDLFELPLVTVRFDDDRLLKKLTVTSLEAPHRVADALLRDSLLDNVIFRKSAKGRILDNADVSNATGLFGLCPTALVFGIWDSTGPRGGLGAKFQRALVSEMVGYGVQEGVKTSSRIDPAQISSHATIYLADNDVGYTTEKDRAKRDTKGNPIAFDRGRGEGKAGNPSKANHSNIPPQISNGGFSFSYARQTTVLSLATLRRLRFPLNGESLSNAENDLAARTLLAALGLMSAVLIREQGADLRSRCLLVPTEAFYWELLGKPGEAEHKRFTLAGDEAIELYKTAVEKVKTSGLPWEGEIMLRPSEDLILLVAKSQELVMQQAEGGE